MAKWKEAGGQRDVAYRQFHYRWSWTLRSSPEALWPLVADTNRFNADTGVPALKVARGATSTSGMQRRLRLFRYGVAIEWDEAPFEWVRPAHFAVVRRYHAGPVAEMTVQADLTPTPAGGTELVYQVWARPKTAIGLMAIPVQIGLQSARTFDRVIRRYDRLAIQQQPIVTLPTDVRLSPGGRRRLDALRNVLTSQGADRPLLDRLINTVAQTDDMAAVRLRPYALADAWGAGRRDVLALCLLATRATLLDLRWDVLCPLCRGVQHANSHLADIRPRGAL